MTRMIIITTQLSIINNKQEATLIQLAGQALRFPHLMQITHMLRVMCRTIDKLANRLEGCCCHEHLLRETTRGDRPALRNYRMVSSGCQWKGAGGAELALGMVDDFVQLISAAGDPWLREAFAMGTEDVKHAMAEMEVSIKAKTIASVQAKLNTYIYIYIYIYVC